MKRDPVDDLSARLFMAAREEPPPPGAERRAIDAAQRAVNAPRVGSGRSLLPLLAAAFAVLAPLVLVLVRSQRAADPVSITAERPSSRLRARSHPPASPSASVVERARDLSSAPAPPSAGVPAPARSAPATLADELAALKVAERALSASDPAAALQALDRYDRALKGKKLRAEATLLRIEALARLGQERAAAELATRFVQTNPSSPLVDRARSFIQPGL